MQKAIDNIEALRDYCLSKKAAYEDLPFGENTLVFKVAGKIFAIAGLDEIDPRVNLKCNPEKAIELREEHPEIIPGYHMNKKHWNTVYLQGDLSENLKKDLIDHSYELVVSSLPGKARKNLEEITGQNHPS